MALAEASDDTAVVDVLLARIAVAAAEVVDGVDYSSITAWRGAGYTTVAASSDLVRAVDDAQYAETAGPCVQAEQTAMPVAVPDMAAVTMSWPGFHEQATRLGLQVVVSVPLFAGGGSPVAVLNMYGRQPEALVSLADGVRHVFAVERMPAQGFAVNGDAGTRQLLNGLGTALHMRVNVQRAVGMLMADTGCDAAHGHQLLRSRAAKDAVSLSAAALRVIDEMGSGANSTDVRVTVAPRVGDVLLVVVSGELAHPMDAAVAGRLVAVLEELAPVMEFDLSGLRFCDVAGLRLLLDLRDRAVAGGRQLRVIAASDALRTLMRITDTAALLGYPPAPESAADGEPAG
ncbi:STAS domain-containing protein [Actinoplanes sp. NBC_00393]|uniref:STAS domain-containing protein n=1 Tax=Actinoplanes sp. NBC_00393 TaxID=2975953 RepID=UPI002E2007C1